MIFRNLSLSRNLGFVAGAAALLMPLAHAASAGDLVVAEYSDESVLRFDPITGDPLGHFTEPGSGGIVNPNGLLFDNRGRLLVSGDSSDSVVAYDGVTGDLIAELVPPNSGGLRAASELLVSMTGDSVIVASYGSDNVLEYDLDTGAFLGEFVTAGDGGLFGPTGMVFGDDGLLYLTSDDGAVLRFDGMTGAFVDTFVAPGNGMSFAAWDLAWGPDGLLYAADAYGNAVHRYDGSNGDYLGAFVPPDTGGMDFPTSLVWNDDGDLLVASEGGIILFDGTTGDFLEVFVEVGTGGFSTPGYMTYIPDGDAGFSLSVDGTCPGQLTLSTTGGTPSRAVAFLYARGEGSLIIPGGPCAGTQLGLNATVKLAATVQADENGDASMVGNAPAGACDRVFLQAVDVATCETSNVIGI